MKSNTCMVLFGFPFIIRIAMRDSVDLFFLFIKIEPYA